MIDIWLLFAQIIPFMEFLLHTILDHIRNIEDEEISGERILTGSSKVMKHRSNVTKVY